MQAVEIAGGAGGPEALTLVERPDPVPGAGEIPHSRTRRRCEPARSAAARRALSAATRRVGHPGSGGGRGGRDRRAGRGAMGRGRSGLRPSGRRRICGTGRGRRPARLAHSGRPRLRSGGRPARDRLHRLRQRLRGGRPEGGETLLIHGATSGIGVTAIQMAKAAGAHVIATSRGADKARAARDLGADLSLDATTDDMAAAIEAFGGADVVLDMVGVDYAALNQQALKPGGRWVVIATLTGGLAQVDLMRLMLKRIVLTGSTLRSRSADEKARLARAVEATVWPWVEQGRVRPPVEATFPLAEAAEAHRRLEAGGHVGKIILTV